MQISEWALIYPLTEASLGRDGHAGDADWRRPGRRRRADCDWSRWQWLRSLRSLGSLRYGTSEGRSAGAAGRDWPLSPWSLSHRCWETARRPRTENKKQFQCLEDGTYQHEDILSFDRNLCCNTSYERSTSIPICFHS